MFRRAGALAITHTSAIGCRTLDVLHVASALILEVRRFLTFDDRQAELPRAEGMDVVQV